MQTIFYDFKIDFSKILSAATKILGLGARRECGAARREARVARLMRGGCSSFRGVRSSRARGKSRKMIGNDAFLTVLA